MPLPRKVALIRGINVGGHKKFPKQEQVTLLHTLGFSDIEVYLHTGNWIFTSNKSEAELAELISKAILEIHEWDVPVLVFSETDIQNILTNCPFPEAIKDKSYFLMLQEVPAQTELDTINHLNYPNEEFYYSGHCIYLYPINGAGRAKMNTNFFEKKLNVAITARNYRTMTKILALLKK